MSHIVPKWPLPYFPSSLTVLPQEELYIEWEGSGIDLKGTGELANYNSRMGSMLASLDCHSGVRR